MGLNCLGNWSFSNFKNTKPHLTNTLQRKLISNLSLNLYFVLVKTQEDTSF